MEFKKYKIEEIGTVVGGGTPSTKNDNYYGGNISWITPKDLSNYSNRYIYHGERNITEEGLNNSSAKLVPTDTILMTSRAPIGYLALAGKKVATNQGFKSIICNEEIVSPKYLYYLLQNKMDNIKSLGTGSTFSEISGKVVKNIEVSLPNLLNQKRVEKVLDSIDEKIELNQKIIANLEELSQTLFKRWFVDFEFPDENGNPYKSSGGEIVDSELGKIPKEWTVKPLNEFIDIIDNRGKTPPLVNEMRAHPIIDVKALSGDTRVIDYKKCLKFVSKETYDTWFRSGHPKKGDTLLSTVGSIGETKMFYHDIGTIAQNVVSLRSENSYFTYDLINNVKSSFLTFNIGSVQPSIKITHINKIKVVYPSKIVIENYEKMIKKFISNLYVRDLENQNLIQLRDTLLPKLMSGEIEIPDDIEVNEDELSI
ncbi:restriction endonuclease subunit S [Mammaliicoccus sciuri]|uniref:restriction endonuclease subunit S n=1 Tax=Mammaliicoccus sciuri TaxID=1296 RepID=UPI0019538DCB|nr:restriction endonuclease subunit S [Mammaliicoccus sciuri]MCJ0943066.1 restriction endonuclease subunit S [Mammaliicoccus sciuri]